MPVVNNTKETAAPAPEQQQANHGANVASDSEASIELPPLPPAPTEPPKLSIPTATGVDNALTVDAEDDKTNNVEADTAGPEQQSVGPPPTADEGKTSSNPLSLQSPAPPPAPPNPQFLRCRCRRTQCIKLMCCCYKAEVPCSDRCGCMGCKNGRPPKYYRRRSLLPPPPPPPAAASAPQSTITYVDPKPPAQGEQQKKTPPPPQPMYGTTAPPDAYGLPLTTDLKSIKCKCRRSKCNKQMCACFHNKLQCTEECGCVGCLNGKPQVPLPKKASGPLPPWSTGEAARWAKSMPHGTVMPIGLAEKEAEKEAAKRAKKAAEGRPWKYRKRKGWEPSPRDVHPVVLNRTYNRWTGEDNGFGITLCRTPDNLAQIERLDQGRYAQNGLLQLGDLIMKVDGVDVRGWPLSRVAESMRRQNRHGGNNNGGGVGAAQAAGWGGEVVLEVYRPGLRRPYKPKKSRAPPPPPPAAVPPLLDRFRQHLPPPPPWGQQQPPTGGNVGGGGGGVAALCAAAARTAPPYFPAPTAAAAAVAAPAATAVATKPPPKGSEYGSNKKKLKPVPVTHSVVHTAHFNRLEREAKEYRKLLKTATAKKRWTSNPESRAMLSEIMTVAPNLPNTTLAKMIPLLIAAHYADAKVELDLEVLAQTTPGPGALGNILKKAGKGKNTDGVTVEYDGVNHTSGRRKRKNMLLREAMEAMAEGLSGEDIEDLVEEDVVEEVEEEVEEVEDEVEEVEDEVEEVEEQVKEAEEEVEVEAVAEEEEKEEGEGEKMGVG